MTKKISRCFAMAASLTAITYMASGTAAAEDIVSRACSPTEVAVFSNRIHVRCAPIEGQGWTKDIPFYAMPLSPNSKQLEYTLHLLAAAKAADKSLRVWVDRDDYQSVPGCRGGDCRRLVAAAMR